MSWHRHKWKVTGAQVSAVTFLSFRTGIEHPKGTVTDVLSVCTVPGCGKSRSKEIEGEWTLAQLGGTS